MLRSCDLASLPHDLRRHLLLGFTGRPHLHASAGVALRHSHRPGDDASVMAADMLLAAWGENPFDGYCVSALAGSAEKLPPSPAELLPVMRAVLLHWRPEITPEARTAMGGAPEEQLAFLRKRLAETPDSLFWWHHLYEFSRITGDWGVLASALTRSAPPDELVPLFVYARANALLASGDAVAAAAMYIQCLDVLPLPVIEERLASAWFRSGSEDRARALLAKCAADRPWNVSLRLRLRDLKLGGPSRTTMPEGRIMVLAYSWNKADDLAATLDSLYESDLGESVAVRVLDNGSTDHTPEVLARFADRFGRERVETIVLPVNAGAPAARNWLMNLPEVCEAEYAAYIDDDIFLPRDWLGRLGEAAKRYPDAVVWGCKVVDHSGPARVQCGEHNLTPDAEERKETLMSTLMLQDGDFGQADYIRPCASVTGCVHLFRAERLLAGGGFDLRFSPTQYDDLERDLRMVLGGGYAVYTGHLAIPHKRRSGGMSEAGRPESANASANLYKLMAKYSPAEFEAMAAHMDRVLFEDLEPGKAAE
ncbi:glycosyltransferase [Pseudodesulfovibrio cashew]|uniref:Glycosyltransferase n=1 Tax=Pseudodesulfovibrio cashew TaxID=2678688 RepID=A0A6I6JC50_9BACT|nr:glycosyltransferase [Pseudodesulfovibrio cashew]QGY38728.1 glycosyltransferase [Pseudodesulfovibrio cashew]